MNINFDNTVIYVIVVIIVSIVFIYLYLIVEPRHNKCWDSNRRECKLDAFKVDPLPDDKPADLIRRLEGYIRLDSEKVFWRRSILNAIIASVTIVTIVNLGNTSCSTGYFNKYRPPIIPFTITTLVLFIAFYFHNSYYSMHFDQRSNIFAKATLNEIKYRTDIEQRPLSSDFNMIK